MKVTIDKLSNISDWIYTGTGEIYLDSHYIYSANNSGKQILVRFKDGDTLEKTYAEPIDISNAENILFNIIGKDESVFDSWKGKVKFTDSLDNSIEYYLQYNKDFQPSVYKNTLNNIKKILFTFSGQDEIFISDIIAVKDDFPIDIYKSIKEKIETYSENYKLYIGKVTCNTGDKIINISNLKYCDKYSVIKIGNEYHQIKSETINDKIQFFSTYSGVEILSDYIDEPVYLVVPINIEMDIIESSIPSLSISNGFNVEPLPYDKFSYSYDSFTESGTYRISNIGSSNKYTINITGMARNKKSLQILFDIIRRLVDDRSIMIYVNGRKTEFSHNGINTLESNAVNELISTISTELEIEITEESYENPDVLELNNTIDIGVI